MTHLGEHTAHSAIYIGSPGGLQYMQRELRQAKLSNLIKGARSMQHARGKSTPNTKQAETRRGGGVK